MRLRCLLLTALASSGLLHEKTSALSLLSLQSQCQRTTGGPMEVAPRVVATVSTRRNLLHSMAAATVAVTLLSSPFPAHAIPMVTTEEFTSIVRDSARSIELVEFSGPKSETIVVRLVDGTNFGLKDIIESPIDPRSPLKVAAVCNANNIPYKFVNLEAMLSSSTRKKKVYANSRVLEAAEKQKEKALRMQEDEELRQAELAEMTRR